jgi:hypothetical protein
MLSEIKRRSRTISKLNKKREALLAKVAAIDQLIRDHGGDVKSPDSKSPRMVSRMRFRNKQSLPEAMAAIMSKEKPMSVNEIEHAVKKNGYKSTSPSFKTIIFQTLGKSNLFKRTERGRYVLK